MAVLVNGERPRIIDPTTGQPFSGYDDGFAVPPVITHASILNQALQVYSAIRRDDAVKFGRRDALAMERDCFLQSIMLELYEAIALLKGQVEPEDPKDPVQQADADWHQKIIERTPHFQQFKVNLLYAIWFGRAGVQQLIGRDQMMGRPIWCIKDHSPIRGDKIEFQYQLDDGDQNIKEGTPLILVSPSHTQKLEKLGAKLSRSDLYTALVLTPGYWRDRFVIHKHLTKDWDPFDEPERQGCVHGYGVRDQIFWLDWVRKEWLSNVSDFIDQVGKGAQIYPYDASNPANQTAAITAAREQSRNTVIVWPVWPGQGGQLLPTPMNVPMDGSRILLDLMQHMEQIIERYIIGQTGSSRSDTSGLGTHDTDFMQNTKYNRIRFNAQNLEETLTDQVLRPLHRWNNPQANYKLFYKFALDKPNAAEMIAAGKVMFDMGIPIKQDEIRGYAGYSKPEPGDAVVQQPQPMMVPGMQQGTPGMMQRGSEPTRYAAGSDIVHLPPYGMVDASQAYTRDREAMTLNVSTAPPPVHMEVPQPHIEVSPTPINVEAAQVHVSPTPINVEVPQPSVNVHAPPVNVSSPVTVNVPEQPAPQVNVNPTPVSVRNEVNPTPVKVSNPVTVNVPQSPPAQVVIQRDRGAKRIVIERDEEGRISGAVVTEEEKS